MRISDWSSDVCSSDLVRERQRLELARHFDAAGIRDTGPQRPIILGLLSAIRQFPTAVLDEQRKDTLGKVTEAVRQRSEEHTSELQSLMRISYAVFCLKKKKT